MSQEQGLILLISIFVLGFANLVFQSVIKEQLDRIEKNQKKEEEK